MAPVAAKASPENAAIRYSIALQYLMLGQKEKALEHAGILAKIDDQYLTGSSTGKQLMAERRTSDYIKQMSATYLAKALEIAWRSSNRNINAVPAIVPDNEDAMTIFKLFREGKGVEKWQSTMAGQQ